MHFGALPDGRVIASGISNTHYPAFCTKGIS
jgi:hypothetical protein